MANNRNVSYTASCDSGYQLNSLGECIACPIGQYRNATETRTCTSCPAGFITLNEASKSRLDCNIGKLLLAVQLYVFLFVCPGLASLSACLCSLLSSSTSVSMSVYLYILLPVCLHHSAAVCVSDHLLSGSPCLSFALGASQICTKSLFMPL